MVPGDMRTARTVGRCTEPEEDGGKSVLIHTHNEYHSTTTTATGHTEYSIVYSVSISFSGERNKILNLSMNGGF